MPSKMLHAYNVLDHFQVTDCWAEKNGEHICIKFRFEKLRLNERSWWAPAGTPQPTEPDYSVTVPEDRCMYCGKLSKTIFQKWICLNEHCNKFWVYPSNGQVPSDATLRYSEAFLRYRTKWPANYIPPYNLRPELFTCDKRSPIMAFSKLGWRGICCPQCGCCSAKVHWDRWECDNKDCNFVHTVEQPVLSARGCSRTDLHEYDGHPIPTNQVLSKTINVQSSVAGHYRVTCYEIHPGNFIYHFQVNRPLVRSPNGPDELFAALQAADIGLERHTMSGRTGKAISASS